MRTWREEFCLQHQSDTAPDSTVLYIVLYHFIFCPCYVFQLWNTFQACKILFIKLNIIENKKIRFHENIAVGEEQIIFLTIHLYPFKNHIIGIISYDHLQHQSDTAPDSTVLYIVLYHFIFWIFYLFLKWMRTWREEFCNGKKGSVYYASWYLWWIWYFEPV